MKIEAIPLKKFIEQTGSVYKNIIITATRARQIIDDRYQEFSVEEDIEDTDQLNDLIENDIDYNIEKPISVATSEFMDKEVEWRGSEEEVEEK